MATLSELNDLLADDSLKNRIRGALLKTQVSVAFEGAGVANHTARIAFCNTIMSDVNGVADKVLKYVIGANAALPIGTLPNPAAGTILGLTDAELQGHVDASLAILAVD